MAGLSSETILYAAIGGILPALVWLVFWLREDPKRPEPRGLLPRTFILGMVAVVFVVPLERNVDNHFPGLGFTAFLLWGVLEELFKFIAAYIGGLHSIQDDEPLDPMIYMITAALGFVALENALFIAGPLINHNFVASVVTGNLRFMGASLLHVVASGVIGFSLSLAFYKSRFRKVFYGLIGIVFAVVFHTAFNIMIVNEESVGGFDAFGAVWVGAALLLVFFDKIKAIAIRR